MHPMKLKKQTIALTRPTVEYDPVGVGVSVNSCLRYVVV
jgi:hypothetical protein